MHRRTCVKATRKSCLIHSYILSSFLKDLIKEKQVEFWWCALLSIQNTIKNDMIKDQSFIMIILANTFFKSNISLACSICSLVVFYDYSSCTDIWSNYVTFFYMWYNNNISDQKHSSIMKTQCQHHTVPSLRAYFFREITKARTSETKKTTSTTVLKCTIDFFSQSKGEKDLND